MAGLPAEVITRAEQVLSDLENHQVISLNTDSNTKKHTQRFVQPILVFDDSHPVIDELKQLNIDNITPVQAIQILHNLYEKSKQ